MAEGFGSHNKTAFSYDHSSISNCLFCLFFCLFLTFSGLLCQFVMLAAGFWLTFYQVSPSSLLETSLKSHLTHREFQVRELCHHAEQSGIGKSSHSYFDFSCIYLS